MATGRLSTLWGRRLLIPGLLAGSVSASHAQDAVLEREAKGQTGRDIRLAVYAAILPDCTAGRLPTVRMSQPPAQGTVTVKQGRMRTTHFKQCLAVEVPVFVAFYRSSPDYVGEDAVTLEVVSAQGKKQLQRFKITVEKRPIGQGI